MNFLEVVGSLFKKENLSPKDIYNALIEFSAVIAAFAKDVKHRNPTREDIARLQLLVDQLNKLITKLRKKIGN